FETVITKPERPKKLRVNQKCTSLKKLKSKEAWRLRRKQGKQVSKEATSAEGHPRPEDQGATAARPDKHSEQQGPGTLPLHRDRVLFQIRKNRGDLQEHLCPDLGVLVARLRPWVELDCSRDDTAAAGGFLERLRVETLGQLVDLLLERGNRVWARIFIEVLGSSLTWAEQLDNQGLNAASVFIEAYGGHLEEMDPSSLLHFAPLQDVLTKQFARPELLRQSGVALMDYLRRAPPQDVRLFIWTLEEHRHHYDHCHTILDEYFEILDHCWSPAVRSVYPNTCEIKWSILSPAITPPTIREHGPLSSLDPLLVGQLGHFPAEAQQKILTSGGLETFLLRSLRFTRMGERVGLARRGVSLHEAGCDLDDLDLFTLPNPYNFTTLPSGSSTGTNVFADEYWPHATGTARGGAAGNPGPASSSSDSDLGDLDLYSSEGEDGVQAEGGPPVESTELRNAEWGLRTAVRTQADLEGRIRRLVKDSEGKALKHKQTVAALEREVEETTANIQVTNQEVELFQQKLEEMVRKDQKEKKANQEELKGLKMETEELAGKCTGLSKSVQEKRKQCDKQLMDFCDLSNQSAAKKMSLEEEIKRCDDLCAEAAARSQRAVLSVLENTCRQNLYCLQKSLSDSREILLKIDEVAFR
ncbi:hypothetical protein CRUP_009646, partial [Coryphaenoides rupestris]